MIYFKMFSSLCWPLSNNSPFPTHTLSPWQPPVDFCLYGFTSSRDFTQVESCKVCPSASGVFLWASCVQDSPVLEYVSEFAHHFFHENFPLDVPWGPLSSCLCLFWSHPFSSSQHVFRASPSGSRLFHCAWRASTTLATEESHGEKWTHQVSRGLFPMAAQWSHEVFWKHWFEWGWDFYLGGYAAVVKAMGLFFLFPWAQTRLPW